MGSQRFGKEGGRQAYFVCVPSPQQQSTTFPARVSQRGRVASRRGVSLRTAARSAVAAVVAMETARDRNARRFCPNERKSQAAPL